jgi:hypothetical protein
MIRFARPARKRSGRKQKRLARIRAARLTLQERRALGDIRVALWKEELHAMAAQSEDAFPGFSCIRRETFELARSRSLETGRPPLSICELYCRAMERYLTGTSIGDLVQPET